MADNNFRLDVLPARKGDCLLLHYGTADDPGLVLIDGGPRGVYPDSLKPRLEQLRAERGLTATEPLIVDMCMLSHIDDDHIVGLLALTKELVTAHDDNKPEIVQIIDLWHNSFDDIVDNDAEELARAVEARFGTASLTGDLPAGNNAAAAMVLASIPQGRKLRDDAKKLGVERNLETEGELIVAAADNEPIDMGRGLSLTVVGPLVADVEKLQQQHADWIAKHPEKVRKSADGVASYDDDSVPNLSSIVVIAESGGKTILFTGDARGDKVLEGLELVGLLQPGGAVHVDVLKCPHHGSINNVDRDFFERIIADHYVISGNGGHGNPDRATLALLADVRGDDEYRIHLTYPVDDIDVERKKFWEKRKPEPWSSDDHSLAAFFDANPAVHGKVVVAGAGAVHTIDLAEQQ